MTHKNLLKTIAQLETKNDMLETEFSHLDTLLKSIGFADGIRTLKEAAAELKTEQSEPQKKAGKKLY